MELENFRFASLNEKKLTLLWLTTLFSLVFFVYLLAPITTSTDSRWTLHIAMSILDEKNIDLNEYNHLMEDRDFRVVYLDEHIYSYFPLGVPIVSVPYVWIVDQVFHLRYSTDFKTYLAETFPNERLAKIEKVAASFISALTAALFFLLASLKIDRLRAFLLAILFAFSTSMLSTASRALWQHGLSVLCLTLVLFLLLQQPVKTRHLFLAGALLGFSYVVRPINSLSVLFLTMYIFVNRRKELFAYGAGLALPVIALLLHGIETYNAILPPYYLPQRLGENSSFLLAFTGNLVSPNRGLLTSTPVFLFSIIGIWSVFKSGNMTKMNIEPYLVAVLLFHWAVISSFGNWTGGESLGPRFFTEMTPYLTFFLIPLIQKDHLWAIKWWMFGFGLMVVISGVIHFRYSTSSYPTIWNEKPIAIVHAPERAWDFLDLQILRGTCEDRIEGTAPRCWFNSAEKQ